MTSTPASKNESHFLPVKSASAPEATINETSPQRFVKIDADGYFQMDDLRVADAEIGRTWLRDVQYDPRFFSRVWTRMDHQDVLIESFDAPYIVLSIDRSADKRTWTATMPYGHSETFALATLTLDEWDRFHGRTERGIPFVFSRSAQASFFDMLDAFDDESIESAGETFEMPAWIREAQPTDPKERWSDLYRKGETPWDLRGPHPSLARLISTLKLQRARILVLGCGRAHDAAWFAKAGHIVTAVDISDEALEQAKAEYGNVPDLNFVAADALNLPPKFDRSFDIVFEHTFYCAVDPAQRNNVMRAYLRALTDDGHLCGFFFVSDKQNGPPYGGSEWELRSRFGKRFRTLYWQRLKDSPAERLGTELFIYSQKLPTLR